MSYASFISSKVDVAVAISQGGCGGGYTEAAMILAGLISGIAAEIWSGKGIDQKRFVELWSRYPDRKLETTKVSIPLFTAYLAKTHPSNAASLRSVRSKMLGPGYSDRVITGDDVDMTEAEVAKMCPNLLLRDIRRYSYGALFYEHVRCGVVHQFHVSESAGSIPMTRRNAGVSYINRLGNSANDVNRLIHFHIPWLADVVRSIVLSFQPNSGPTKKARPKMWWIDGG